MGGWSDRRPLAGFTTRLRRSYPHDVRTTEWAGIRARVERLRHSPTRAAVFGADGHRFELAPRLSTGEINDVERQLGISLPAQYRGFLTAVGAGGAGPAYGIFPLQRAAKGRWTWTGDGAE